MSLLNDVGASLARRDDESLIPPARRGQGLHVLSVRDVAPVNDRMCIAVISLDDGREALAPLVSSAGRWRRAEAPDGLSMLALRAGPPFDVTLMADLPQVEATRERAITADMSNEVRVIDERVAVKWQFLFDEGSLAGPRLVQHLSEVGFRDMPEPLAHIAWADHLVAAYYAYLPGAQDGWEWMLDDVLGYLDGEASPPAWPSALGDLTGRLHAAAITPSRTLPNPIGRADLKALAGHYRALRGIRLDDEMREALDPWRERIEQALHTLDRAHGIEIIPVHGDLHAGQFLRWDGGIFVSDFDGNPLLPPPQRGDLGPSAIDVAGLVRTLDHVCIAAARRSSSHEALSRGRAWFQSARTAALESYLAVPGVPTLDLELLNALETLSPLHEAVYAATYLPRWRYVPLTVLREGR